MHVCMYKSFFNDGKHKSGFIQFACKREYWSSAEDLFKHEWKGNSTQFQKVQIRGKKLMVRHDNGWFYLAKISIFTQENK
jgi:hypothetical protein